MKFRIPFVISSDIEILKRRSKAFIKFTSSKKSKLDEYLKDSEVKINKRQYLSITYRYFLLNFLVFTVVGSSILGIFKKDYFVLFGLGAALLISLFIFMNQVNYPKIYSKDKARSLEKNLIPMLQDMVVQLNSGIPIFQIMVNISGSDYGEVSNQFRKITKEINSGVPQIEAIENHGKLTSSRYFKRILWQISNGMRAGTDMTVVIREGVKNLSEEQAVQIQKYGGKLNPLIMFYMLIAVIIPSLGVTFMIIISSLLDIPQNLLQGAFFGVFGIVIFIQIMFIGVLKSGRPTLI